MKRIIVYGIWNIEIRRKIEFFISKDEYEIIGYSDTYAQYDELDGKNFFTPVELLGGVAYDYIVLSSFVHAETMIKYLVRLGVSFDKILVPYYLKENSWALTRANLVKRIDKDIEKWDGSSKHGILFGMSNANRAIDTKKTIIPFLNCTGPSIDIYYSYKLFKHIEENHHLYLTNTTDVIISYLYYVFDFDLSRSLKNIIQGSLFQVMGLDDWHNITLLDQANKALELMRMFGDGLLSYYRCYNEKPIFDNCYGKLNMRWDSILMNKRAETEQENIRVLTDFISLLNKYEIKISILVPPIYGRGLDAPSQDALKNKKKMFYDLIESIGAFNGRVLDYSGIFEKEYDLFYDIEHLNEFGRARFTKYLNSKWQD